MTADLDCTAAADKSIQLLDGSLDLNGHTLSADVYCLRPSPLPPTVGNCVVRGPGTIEGCVRALQGVSVDGVTFLHRSELCGEMEGQSATDAAVVGTRVTVRDSDISGYPQGCVRTIGGGLLESATVVNSTLSDCQATPDSGGPAIGCGGRVKVTDSTLEGAVVAGRRASVKGTTIVAGGNLLYPGVRNWPNGGSTKVVNSSITGMYGPGVRSGHVKLKASAIISNCTGVGANCAGD